MTPGVLQSGIVLQGDTTTELLVSLLARLLGVAAAAGGVSALAALAYRWYVRERIQTGLAVLFGLTVVVLYLGTTTALGQVIGGEDEVLEATEVLKNISAFAVGGFGAYTGTRVGDRLGADLFAATGGRAVDADVSEIVQTVGRVTSVRLPEKIEDIVGYDPSPEATKEKLAGRRFLFPRRLTKAELRDRLVSRLKTDYGVGHVDLELADDGSVDYLAIGSRAAGLGPTLPPATNALAIQADPANAASAGDLVQVWETNPAERVLTGELRGVAGDVVTVAIDAADTPKLDPATRYKLVTLPVQDRPDREFASLLRAADETMGTVTVDPGSALDGKTVGALEVTVVAITREDEPPETIPGRSRTLAAGDTLYAIATPDALRRLEEAAVGTGEGTVAETDAMNDPEPSANDVDEGDVVPNGSETDDGQTAVSTDAAETEAPAETTETGAPSEAREKGTVSDGEVDGSGGADAAEESPDPPDGEPSESETDGSPSADETEDDPVPAGDAADVPVDDGGDANDTAEPIDDVEVWDPSERIGNEHGDRDDGDDGSRHGSAGDDEDADTPADGADDERDGREGSRTE